MRNLPSKREKCRAEAKLRQRHRTEENLIQSLARQQRCLDNDGWETVSESDSSSATTVESTEVAEEPESSVTDSQIKRIPYTKRIKRFRLSQDVSSIERELNAEGQWPKKFRPRLGHYAVGPSRIEIRNFRRKQLIFNEIIAILQMLDPMSFWFSYRDLLKGLKTMVFKELNTGLRGTLSVEQIMLLRSISFLEKGYMPPSVVERSSVRATPSKVTFGYHMWTNSPKAVITSY